MLRFILRRAAACDSVPLRPPRPDLLHDPRRPGRPRRGARRGERDARAESPRSASSTASTGRCTSSSSSISARSRGFEFGESAYSRRPVALDIKQRLPATLELTISALLHRDASRHPARHRGGGLPQPLARHAAADPLGRRSGGGGVLVRDRAAAPVRHGPRLVPVARPHEQRALPRRRRRPASFSSTA